MLIEDKRTVYIFQAKVTDQLSTDCCEELLSQLPKAMSEQNKRYQQWEDRRRHLLGKLLLLKGFHLFGLTREDLRKIKYTKYGRPYLSPDIDFNIAHSGQYVLCAISLGARLGIDIEQIKTIEFGDFQDTINANEWASIYSAPNVLKRFYDIWAMKESVVKADGRGLSVPPHDIVLEDSYAVVSQKKWFLTKLLIDEEYASYLASDAEDCKITFDYSDLSNGLVI
jgi:4'-phosphopantetheinyl transferase